MNNFLNKITVWFKPRSIPKKRTSSPKPKIKKPYSFNSRYYNKLIGKLTSQAIAIQRRRTQQKKGVEHE